MNIPDQSYQITKTLNNLKIEVNSSLNEVKQQLKNLKDLEKQVIKDDSQFIKIINSTLKIPGNSN
mgnify:FL=1